MPLDVSRVAEPALPGCLDDGGRDGAQFAREKGVQRVQFETDCQELANLWTRGGGNQTSHVAPIIKDIIEICSVFS